ncbi:MAG: amidohydrolase family protein, partial [bacterium]|nr:amidohydrolase family protein [bacterium]
HDLLDADRAHDGQRLRAGAGGPRPIPGSVAIEHGELLDEDLLDRIRENAIGLSCQPNFVARWQQPGGLYDRALGSERVCRMNPFRAIHDRGIPMAFGSDGMPMDPALGLCGAVEHPMAGARLTSEEALTTYLGGRLAPAGVWEQEDWWTLGRNGAVLYDRDPLELARGDLSRVPVQGVLWGGDWVLEPPSELFRTGVLHVG